MTQDQLTEFVENLPFDSDHFIELHNKIVNDIKYELWKFREEGLGKISHPYAAWTNIFNFKSLQPIKQ